MDIKCRMADLHPDAAVAAAVRVLKYHGGLAKTDVDENGVISGLF